MRAIEEVTSTHSREVLNSAIGVVETSSHCSLSFLTRETHVNNVVDRRCERSASQETTARAASCWGLGKLLCCRLSRLRGGFSVRGLSRLGGLDRLSGLDGLRGWGPAGGGSRCYFWLRNVLNKPLRSRQDGLGHL